MDMVMMKPPRSKQRWRWIPSMTSLSISLLKVGLLCRVVDL
jgi:hypothetical protein